MIKISEQQEQVLQDALITFGDDAQIWMAIEEMAELTNALMKLQRGRVTIPDVVEEIADVKIMCEQLAYVFGQKEVETQVSFKTNRLRMRMDGEVK